MSPAVVVEKEPVPAAEKTAPKTVAAAASKAEKRKVPPTEAAPSVAAKKAVPPTVTPPAATEPAKQVATFCCAHIRCFFIVSAKKSDRSKKATLRRTVPMYILYTYHIVNSQIIASTP
jgi:hypothetical protein